MKTKFFFLAIVALLSFSPMAMATTDDVATKQTTQLTCGVTCQQVYDYMLDQGFVIVSMYQIDGTCNVNCKSADGKNFIVYIENASIIGYDETGNM